MVRHCFNMKQKSFIAVTVSLIIAIIFSISLWPYYPNKTKLLLAILPLFAIFACTNRGLSVLFIFAIMPFFGNHPGGRFIELFILLCFIWAITESVSSWPVINAKFSTFYNLLLVVVVLPLILNSILWHEFNYHKTGLYYILFANEHSSLYILQQTLWILFVSILVYQLKPHLKFVVIGVGIAFTMTISVGFIEAFVPVVAQLISKVHIYVTGYSDIHLPHGIALEWINKGWVTRSPQSFFFNRSWHSVYLIAALPFVAIAYTKLLQGLNTVSSSSKRLLTLSMILIFSFYLLLIGARGAWIAWVGFLFVLSVGFILNRILKTNSRKILPIIVSLSVIAAFIVQILLPILTIYFKVNSQEPRYLHFAAAFHIFSMFPVWGGGTEAFGFWNSHSLQLFGLSSTFGSSHNAFLQILAGNGLLGAGLYISIVLLIANQLKNRLKKELTEQSDTTITIIMAAGIVATLLYGSVQELNYIRPVTLLWFLLFGLPFYDFKSTASIKAEKSYKSIFIPVSLIFILLVGFFFGYGRALITAPQSNIDLALIRSDNLKSLPTTKKAILDDFQKLPIQGGEYYAKENKFIIMQGQSTLLLPIEINHATITNLNQNQIYAGWQIDENQPQYHLLHFHCQRYQSYQIGDPDSRKLCFELTFDQPVLLNQTDTHNF